jgi:hypothetical protein
MERNHKFLNQSFSRRGHLIIISNARSFRYTYNSSDTNH